MPETTERLNQDDYYDDDDGDCFWCGGEGLISGGEMDDPMWYDADEFYRCPSCRGSGARKDMTLM